MNEYTPTWGLPVPALTQQELAEELEIAQKDGANFRNSSLTPGRSSARSPIASGAMGGCRLWFMDDTEFARWMSAPISAEHRHLLLQAV